MRLMTSTVAVAMLAGTALASTVTIGEKLAPFALKNYDGKNVDLKSYQGNKAVVLMFISTQCPVSNGYNDRMASLAKDYTGKGVAVVGINANKQESTDEIARHAKEHGFPFPVLKDEGNVQADHFGAQVTPEVYVYDSSWTLRYHGRIDDDRRGDNVKSQDLRNALDAVLSGKDVAVTETKAFGCTIKRVQQ
jgi:peroxiredoxin